MALLLGLLGCLDGGTPTSPVTEANVNAVSLTVAPSLVTVGTTMSAKLRVPTGVVLEPGSVSWIVTPSSAGTVQTIAGRPDSASVLLLSSGTIALEARYAVRVGSTGALVGGIAGGTITNGAAATYRRIASVYVAERGARIDSSASPPGRPSPGQSALRVAQLIGTAKDSLIAGKDGFAAEHAATGHACAGIDWTINGAGAVSFGTSSAASGNKSATGGNENASLVLTRTATTFAPNIAFFTVTPGIDTVVMQHRECTGVCSDTLIVKVVSVPKGLRVTTESPVKLQAGVKAGTLVTAALVDNSGRILDVDDQTVTATLINGNAKLSGATAKTTAGSATFSDLTLDGPAGAYTLRLGSSIANATTDLGVALSAGAASTIAFVRAFPNAWVLEKAIAPCPVVQVTDASGNPVAKSGVTATVTASNGAVLATVTTDANGRASLCDITLTSAMTTSTADGKQVTLTLAVPSLSVTKSITIAVTTGDPTLTLEVGALTLVAGSTATIVAAVKDGAGNVVATSAKNPETFLFRSTDPSVAPVDDAGVVTGLKTGSTQIQISAMGTTSTVLVTVVPGAASPLRSRLILGSTSLMPTEPTSVTVEVRDSLGNAVTSATPNSFVSGVTAGQLSVFTCQAGICTATYTAPATSTTAQLSVTISGQNVIGSPATITVGPGAVDAQRSTVTVDASTIFAGETTTLNVTPRDARGNAIGNSTLSVSARYNGGTSTVSIGSFTYQASDATYRATVTGVRGGTATTLIATVSGTTLAQQPSLRVRTDLRQATLGISLASATIGYAESMALSTTGGSGTGAVTYEVTAGTDICSVSGATVTGTKLGTCTVTATKAADATYASTSATADVTVVRANQTITFGSAPTVVVGGTGTITVSASSGLPVTLRSTTTSVCTLSGTTVTGVSLGTCTITANQAGDSNYYAAPQASKSFSVTASGPGSPSATTSTLAVSPATVTAGGTVTVTVTVKDSAGNVITSATSSAFTATVSAGTLGAWTCTNGVCTATYTASAAGTQTVAVTIGGGAISGSPASITVNKATQAALTATATPSNIAVSGTSTLATSGGSGTGAVTYAVTSGAAVCSVVGSTLTGNQVGSCTVTATKADDGTYDAATATVSVSVGLAAQATLTAAAASTTIDYYGTTTLSTSGGSGTGAVTYAVTSGGDVCAVSGTTLTGTKLGTCTVTATKAADATYASATGTVDVTVNKAVLTVTAGSQSVAYGTAAATVTGAGSYTVTGYRNGEGSGVISGSVTYTTTYTNTTAPATAGVTITPVLTGLTATNYSFTGANGTITVTKASQTIGAISFSPASLAVGGTTTASATASSGLTVAFTSTTSSVCTVSGATVTGVTTGTCTIAANQSGNGNYDAAAQVTQNVSVTSADVSVVNSSLSLSANTVTAGGTVTVTVTIKDASNNLITDANETAFTFTKKNGTFGASWSCSGGVCTNVYTASTTAGLDSIWAKHDGTNIGGSPQQLTVTAGAATQIAVSGGNGQSATVGTAVATPPSVIVKDANNNPVSGVSVTFAVATGGGSATGTSATTDASGIATVGSWTLGSTAGSNTLTATSGVLTGSPVTFTATGTAGTASQLAITTQPVGGASGAVLATQPVVQIRDASGNLTSSTAAVTVAIKTGSGGTLGGTLTVNAVAGVATFTNVTLAGTAGTNYTLEFTSTGLTPATSNNVSVTAGGVSAGNSTVSASPTSVVADNVATSTITVTLKDANSNLVQGATVSLAQGSGSSTISAASGLSDASGVVTFTVKSTKAEVVTYTATGGGVTITQTAGVTFTAGGLDHFEISVPAPGAALMSGETDQSASTSDEIRSGPSAMFSTPDLLSAAAPPRRKAGVTITGVTITAQDANNNTVTSFNSTVTYGGSAGHTGNSGTFSNGVATSESVTPLNAGNSRTLTVTDGSGHNGSSNLDVDAGDAATLVLSTPPDATAGSRSAYTVTRRDAYGNSATTGVTTVDLSSNSTGSKKFYNASSGGSEITSVSIASGDSTAAFWYYDDKVGSWVVTVASTGLVSATDDISITVGSLDHFKVTKTDDGALGNQTVGVPFNVKVVAQDAYNNTVTSFSSTVAISAVNATLTGQPVTSAAFTSGVLSSESLTFSASGSSVTVSVTDGATPVAHTGQSASFTAIPALSTTSAVAAKSLTVNIAYSAFTPVTATGGTEPRAFALRNAANSADASLPAGMTFSTSTGEISGTATAELTLTTYTVRVTDALGVVSSKAFDLTVNPALQTTQAVANTSLLQDVGYSPFTPVTASGGTSPLSFTLRNAGNTANATLPSGMSFSGSTGEVSGTATVPLNATTFTVAVSDANGATSSKTFSLTVTGPLTTTQAVASKELTVNTAYSGFTPVTANGGTSPYSFAVSPSLPTGMSMSSSTGEITGTPSATQTIATFTVTATDAAASPASSSKTFSLTVNSAPVATQAVASTALTVSTPYSAFTPVTGSGGTGTLTYSLRNADNSADATLPAGMSFSTSNGQISGTATATLSTSTFTVRVTDTNGATATATFSLTVNSAPIATQAVASKALTVNTSYTAFTPVTGSGGTGTLTYALRNAANSADATLPAGMSFSTSTGQISTTATVTLAATTFTVRITDTNGATASATFNLTVNSLPVATQAIASKALTVNTAYTAFIPVTGSGGTGTLTYALRNSDNSADASLPSGMAFSTSTGQITTTATATLGTTTFTVRVTDTNGATATATFSLTVNAAPTATQAVASKTLTTNLDYVAFTPVTGALGTAPLSYTLRNAANSADATLPTGMSFNASTGEISGTATAILSATTFTVRVADANSATATMTFVLTVANPSINVVTSAAGAASRIAFTTQPQVEILDALGAHITSGTLASTTVTMSVSGSGTTYVSGSAATATATLASGVKTFANAGIGGTIGTYTLTYSATNVTSATQSITLTAGAVAKTHVVGPATLVSSAISEPITIYVRDADGNQHTVQSNTSFNLASVLTGGVVGATATFSASPSMSPTTTSVTVLSGYDTVSFYYTNTSTTGTLTISATNATVTSGNSTYATSATPAGTSTSMQAAPDVSTKYRCTGTGTANQSANSTVVTGCAVLTGDLLVAAVNIDAGNSGAAETITPPSGWTAARSVNDVTRNSQLAIFWKVATASDLPSGGVNKSYTFTWTGSPSKYASAIVAYKNVNTISPIDTSSSTTGSGAVATSAAIKTRVQNTTLLFIYSWSGANALATSISNFSVSADINKVTSTSANNSAQTILFSDMDRVAAGSTGARTADGTSASVSGYSVSTVIAIKPAP